MFGKKCYFHASMGGFIQDEKSHKETFSLKGASGLKVCCKCMNVLADKSPPPGDYYASCGETDRNRFDLHTPESFNNMDDILEAKYME